MENIQDNIEKIIEHIDQESREFTLLQNTDNFIALLKKDFQLSEEQESIIDGEITLFLLKQSTLSDFRNQLEQHLSFSMSNDTKHSLIEKLYSYVSEPLEVEEGLSSVDKLPEPTTPPSPSDMLARLNQTMTTPTTLGSTKRSVGEGSVAASAPTSKPDIKTIDPYRELPEVK